MGRGFHVKIWRRGNGISQKAIPDGVMSAGNRGACGNLQQGRT